MSTPSITVAVDPTNPGQFFACCGLLELADRLWQGAEGWFGEGGREFHVACDGTLHRLLEHLGKSQLQSSLGDSGLKRLGSLLSQAKATLSAQDEADKTRLQAQWKVERVTLTSPFNVTVDWWWDEQSGVTMLKTWAAKQFVLEIARPMLVAIRQIEWSDESPSNCLNTIAKLSGLPFYFDSVNNAQNTPRDMGFAQTRLKSVPSDRPLLELLAFIALQRFRPQRPDKSPDIRYATWALPLPPSVAAVVASGLVAVPGSKKYVFRMLYRTEYMKAFLPSIPVQGD